MIGCSGWSYRDWRGVVYPMQLPAAKWLAAYAEQFQTVEVNNTFYRLPSAEAVSKWRGQVPPGFVFAVKASRYGTHRLKLLHPERWLSNYLERALLLGPSLGPNLVQLPPNWRRDAGRLRDFLQLAAAVTGEVARSLTSRTGQTVETTVKWAVEFRDASWLHESTYEVLREHAAALCCHDLVDDHPWVLTAPWGYARFHGPRATSDKYLGEYTARGLETPAARLRSWLSQGADLYAYFNNDHGGAAARDATSLRALLA